MKVEITQEEIQTHIGQAVTDGLAKGMQDWKVLNEISTAASDAIMKANIPQLLGVELSNQLEEFAPKIVAEVAESIVPATKEAFRVAFRQAAVSMVYGVMQGKPSYLGDDGVKLWKLAEQTIKKEAGE